MRKARLDPADILASGRASQGIARLDQIKYAVLEQGGTLCQRDPLRRGRL